LSNSIRETIVGISSDGLIAFGIDLGEEGLSFLEDFDNDFDEYVSGQYPVEAPEGYGEEYNEWFEGYKKFADAYPVDLVMYCSYEYPMYFLAVRGTYQSVSRGYCEEFKNPTVTTKQIKALENFCKGHDIEFKEPKWCIMSMFG
jgi:hypothetical protein